MNSMQLLREAGAVLVLAALVFSPALPAGQARPPQPPPGFPDLVGALKSTPGCVGVEVARTGSGKQVIFAWFEDKKAALNWYYSDTHQSAMKQFFPQSQQAPKRTPMKDVPDDDGPVLAIASLTLADRRRATSRRCQSRRSRSSYIGRCPAASRSAGASRQPRSKCQGSANRR